MNLEQKAIKFIQTIANTIDVELYAGNSGGKDSAVLDYLLQKSGIKYNSFHTVTTIDPKGTLSYIRNNYPHTKILIPELSFYKLVEKKGLPTRLNRYCCERLKEYASVGKVVFEGVRSCESSMRKNRDYIQCDTRKSQKNSQHIYPIYDWTDQDVWNFIKEKNIKVAPAYSNGSLRLGCIGCPQVRKKGVRRAEFKLYPGIYNRVEKAILTGMKNNPQWKITKLTQCDSQKAMNWWLSGLTMDDYFGVYQQKLNL